MKEGVNIEVILQDRIRTDGWWESTFVCLMQMEMM